MKPLLAKGFIFKSLKRAQNSMKIDDFAAMWVNVKLTGAGKRKAEKALPKLPMVGLVSQEIKTGDVEIDEKINYARQLFFDDPVSIDKMRSACEALTYILERLHDKLKIYFTEKDVSDFFPRK